MRIIIMFAFISTVLLACASGHAAKSEVMEKIHQLYSKGDQDGAIEYAKKLAADPDPEIRFGVGYLFFERSQNESSRPALAAEDLAEAMRLIQGAANDNLQQAASFMAVAHEQGLYGASKNAILAECWRDVAKKKKTSIQCR